MRAEEFMSPALKRLLPGLLVGLLTMVMIGASTWLQRANEPDRSTTTSLTPDEIAAWVQVWQTGTTGRRQVDEGLPTSEARLLVVRALIEQSRAPDMEICRLLHESSAKDWCRATLGRPHLYEVRQAPLPTRERPGGGPVDTQLVASRALMDLKPSGPAPKCADHSAPRICAAETAIDAGLRSDPAAVREACLHIEPGRWRDECVFMAAERLHKSVGDAALAQTTWLCAHAGQFNHHCLKRIIDTIASGTPPADSPHGWQHVVDRANSIRIGLDETDPILSRQTVDWYYAQALDQAYAKATVVQGGPLDWLPTEAHPHVRAAAIERLVHALPATARTIDDWALLTEQVMTSVEPVIPPMARESVESHPPSNLWGVEESEEASLPAVYWRGAARRLQTDDAAADRLVCLLESLARHPRAASHQMADLAEHPDSAVRLTAKRLAYAVSTRRD